jgi:hypothetical protein
MVWYQRHPEKLYLLCTYHRTFYVWHPFMGAYRCLSVYIIWNKNIKWFRVHGVLCICIEYLNRCFENETFLVQFIVHTYMYKYRGKISKRCVKSSFVIFSSRVHVSKKKINKKKWKVKYIENKEKWSMLRTMCLVWKFGFISKTEGTLKIG